MEPVRALRKCFLEYNFPFLFADIPVTPVSERCDDKATTVAKILVAIVDTGSYHPHYRLLLLKVISQL